MNFFSGFGFRDEKYLFESFLKLSDFSIAGFSYGAIKAFERAYLSSDRVDTLQLFSPAFFINRSERFKNLQLRSYQRDKEKYLENFYKNVLSPSDLEIEIFKSKTNKSDLERLLFYEWDKEALKELVKRGVKIEVFVGSEDKIIDAKSVAEYFKEFAQIYFIKGVGHLLR
jgi:surfactin synthase thioesterase subunit